MDEDDERSCVTTRLLLVCLGSVMTIFSVVATFFHCLFWIGLSTRSSIDFMDIMFPLVGFLIYFTNLSYYCFVWCQSCCGNLSKSFDYSIIFVCLVILLSLLNGLISHDLFLMTFFCFYAFLNLLFVIIACMMKRESQENLKEMTEDEPRPEREQEQVYKGSYSKDAIPKFPIPIYMQKIGYTREIDGPIYL